MYNLSTKAHEGPSSQRRPTQAHEEGKRPICMFFLIMYFSFYFSFFILLAGCTTPTTPLFGVDDSHKSPRRPQPPTKANAGPQRGKRAQTTPDASFGPIGKFFNVIFYFILITRRPSTHPPLACKYEPGVGLLTTTTTTTTTTPPSSLANSHLTPQRSPHTTTTHRSPHLD